MASALPFMEPIHVIGAGSIGLFFASSVRSAFPSYPLSVLFRPHRRSTMNQLLAQDKTMVVCTRQLPGILSTNKRQQPRPQLARVPFQFTDKSPSCNSSDDRRKIRNFLVCTKAYQAVPAIRDIQHRFDTTTQLRIILLCNGALDVRDKLEKTTILQKESSTTLQNVDLIMGSTTHGVINESLIGTSENGLEDDDDGDEMFHLLHVGMGKTYLGMGASSTKSIAQLMDQSGLHAKSIANQEMEVLLWKKLAANCVCNPLSALWDVPNGKLQDHHPSFATLRAQIVQEISSVGRALQPELQDGLSIEALDSFVEQVIQANLHNKSSMNRDIQRKQQTEIENLNGYVVRKTTELCLGAAPANEELLGRIQDLTAGYTYDYR
ncbi:2-dehydropantoate 2-reductase [Nitzschia inconspicua]|uniref:2-dehydropantoate 2-reductase n=1 Tax=Nitzschia inconspicua TaxID=303405 RepID=A0A9K3KER8_9STRA|nr:2-dehydropantoate 2-reductase [Nitzschia inconspicua]